MRSRKAFSHLSPLSRYSGRGEKELRMSFANQVAIITGASSGIGWELAKTLARQGATVGLVARRKERLETLALEIQAFGGKVAYQSADVADRQQIVTAI